MVRTAERTPGVEQYKVPFQSMPWVTPAAGVRFKIHQHGGKRLRLVEFTKEFVEPDWCAAGHFGYVLEGQLEIDFDGNPVVLNPGDGIFIPAGEQHKHVGRTLTDVARVILVEDV